MVEWYLLLFKKFSPENDNVFECLSLRDNIIVIADEAHRTQYGFDAKVVEEKSKVAMC